MLGSVNYMTTIILMRAPGMTMFRLPMTIWAMFITAVLQAFALPVLTAAGFMQLADRSLGTGFFTPEGNDLRQKERRELESEAAKRQQEKDMTKKYQEHLRLQMIKEKEDDSLLEELRRQDEEKTWKKREDQYNREQGARRELHEAVMAGRDEQLRLKAERAKVDAAVDVQQVEIFKRENARLAELDA